MALSLAKSQACATTTQQRRALALGRPSVQSVSLRQPNVTTRSLGGGGQGPDKKFISREEEPEEYWSSKNEKEGLAVFTDPLAIIGVIAILFPFIFVLIAIATGAIDTSVYK